jgi:predicted enzyme related to lactoylglutathione lyase
VKVPEFNSYPAGTPSWVDLASPDPAGSNAFYGALFDWEAYDLGPDAGNYALFRKGGKNVAGSGPIMMDGQPTAWTTYVGVDDCDATVELAKKAGAAVFVEPMDVMQAGRMAIFADPTGAVLGVWQPKDHKGADLANEPGTFTWNELDTRDVPAAKSFYSEVFGWQPNDMDMGGLSYTEWKLGDRSVAGMMPMPEMVPPEVPANWLVYFAVTDCDAAVAKATDLGATVLVPATDITPGRFAVLSDPAGAVFAVIKTNPPSQ